jgi:hypothetical protein
MGDYCQDGDINFAQRAFAAFLAIIFLLLGESFAARALPPLNPPSFPSATAAGFFSLVAFSTKDLASWFMSLMS